MKYSGLAAALLTGLLAGGCGSGSVNETIRIADGERVDGGARSVNGSIIVGEAAELKGDVNTVNGNVRLHDRAQAGDIKTVNGDVKLGTETRTGNIDSVNGSVRAGSGAFINSVKLVNGSFETGPESVVAGDAYLVSGAAELRGTRVEGNLVTYSGQLMLTDGSAVNGNVEVRKPRGTFSINDKPRVIVGPDSSVEGKIVAERPIRLFVHDTASIGAVEGAEPEPYAARMESGG